LSGIGIGITLADLSPGIVEPHGTEPHKPPPLRLTADIRVLRCFFCINVFLLYIFFFFLGFGMLDLLGTLGLLGLIGTLDAYIYIIR
jgi:hypothetical protein